MKRNRYSPAGHWYLRKGGAEKHSKFEDKISEQIEAKEGSVNWQPCKLQFTQPVKHRSYTPDFKLKNDIYIETKGYFPDADSRNKFLLIRDCNPSIDLRFVFHKGSDTNTITTTSKTTYAMWCDQKGFKYAVEKVPEEWFDE